MGLIGPKLQPNWTPNWTYQTLWVLQMQGKSRKTNKKDHFTTNRKMVFSGGAGN